MADVNDVLVSALKTSHQMMQMTVADMSDAELMTRPTTGANHPNWQIGHVVSSESKMLMACGVELPACPEGAMEKYAKTAAANDDAKLFLAKAELVPWMNSVRAAAIEFAQSATSEQLKAPAPEGLRKMAPAISDVFILMGQHYAMHLGQIQVLRRHTGKAILF